MRGALGQIASKYRGEAVLMWVVMVWGTTFALVKDIIVLWPPFALMSVRFALAALMFLPWLLRDRGAERETWRNGMILGLLVFAGFALQTLGLAHTTEARSAFFTAISVLLVPFLGWFFFRLPIVRGTILGVLLGALGIVFLLGQGLGPEVLQGDYLTLGCALAFAAQILFLSEKCRKGNLFVLIGVEMLTVMLLSISCSLASSEVLPASWPDLPEIVYLGIIATGLTLLAQIYGQRYTSATRAAFCFAFEPVFACIFAWFWSGRSLSGLEWAGAACILLAVLVAEKKLVKLEKIILLN